MQFFSPSTSSSGLSAYNEMISIGRQRKITQQLRAEAAMPRMKVSETVKDMVDFCARMKDEDHILRCPLERKDNPFIVKGGCNVLWYCVLPDPPSLVPSRGIPTFAPSCNVCGSVYIPRRHTLSDLQFFRDNYPRWRQHQTPLIVQQRFNQSTKWKIGSAPSIGCLEATHCRRGKMRKFSTEMCSEVLKIGRSKFFFAFHKFFLKRQGRRRNKY